MKKRFAKIIIILIFISIILLWINYRPVSPIKALNLSHYSLNEISDLRFTVDKYEFNFELNTTKYDTYNLTKNESIDFYKALSNFMLIRTHEKEFANLKENILTYYTILIVDDKKPYATRVIISDKYFNFFEHRNYIYNNKNLIKFLGKFFIGL